MKQTLKPFTVLMCLVTLFLLRHERALADETECTDRAVRAPMQGHGIFPYNR